MERKTKIITYLLVLIALVGWVLFLFSSAIIIEDMRNQFKDYVIDNCPALCMNEISTPQFVYNRTLSEVVTNGKNNQTNTN